MRHHSPTFVDYLAVFGLGLLAVIPFHQVFHLKLGFAIVNTGELLLLFLLSILLVAIAVRGVVKSYAPYVAFVFVIFAVYTVSSLLFLDVGAGRVMAQTRNFLPFLVASVALLARLYIPRNEFVRKMAYMVACSAILAVAIHFVFRDFIAYAFAANDEVTQIILQGGRMYWGSAALAFFVLAAFLLEQRRDRRIILAALTLVAFVGILLTQNRTLLAGLLVFYMVVQIFVFKRSVRAVVAIVSLLMVAAGFFFWLASDDMASLLKRRLFLAGDSASELDHSFGNRFALYDKYVDVLQATFPIGQGLGSRYTVNSASGDPIYTTDISLLSFVLPLGVFGFLIFVGFIFGISRSFKKYSRAYKFENSGKVFGWLVFSALFVSLNFDLFSRNIFVVYLAVFAVLHDNARKVILGGPTTAVRS